MGSVSVEITHRTLWGDCEIIFGKLTMSSSYATGGDTLNPRDLGLENITHLFISQRPAGYDLKWDKTNNKILAYQYPDLAGPATEVGTATNLSGVEADFIAIGVHG